MKRKLYIRINFIKYAKDRINMENAMSKMSSVLDCESQSQNLDMISDNSYTSKTFHQRKQEYDSNHYNLPHLISSPLPPLIEDRKSSSNLFFEELGSITFKEELLLAQYNSRTPKVVCTKNCIHDFDSSSHKKSSESDLNNNNS